MTERSAKDMVADAARLHRECKMKPNGRDRCLEIADQIEPRYRTIPGKYPSCTGTIAKRWGAAYDGAAMALQRQGRKD